MSRAVHGAACVLPGQFDVGQAVLVIRAADEPIHVPDAVRSHPLHAAVRALHPPLASGNRTGDVARDGPHAVQITRALPLLLRRWRDEATGAPRRSMSESLSRSTFTPRSRVTTARARN